MTKQNTFRYIQSIHLRQTHQKGELMESTSLGMTTFSLVGEIDCRLIESRTKQNHNACPGVF